MRLFLSILVLTGAGSAQAQDPDWYAQGHQTIEQRRQVAPITGPAKNIILFVGDGMGISTVTAARIFDGQSRGESGEENSLSFERLPHTALIKTYNTNAQVSDSAGTATALLSGVKTKIGVIGVNDKVRPSDCTSLAAASVPTIIEMAEDKGMATGIVTTTRLTHATPAAAYAHIPNRNWESDVPEGQNCTDIAGQFVDFNHGDGIEVVLGGGRANFLPRTATGPEGAQGRRADGADLIAAWQARYETGTYVWNQAGFDALSPAADGPVLGLFNPSHMQYEADRARDKGGEPSLAEMVRFAVEKLARSNKGYVLLVEAGRIDHAHHGTNAYRALKDTQALAEAVDVAMDLTDAGDTLILVTADHSHTLSIAGYPPRGNPILGTVKIIGPDGQNTGRPRLAGDDKAYTTLGYINGSSAVDGARPDLSDETARAQNYQQQTLVRLNSETHGGEDVALFARGPEAYLVGGVWEQHAIFHLMDYALGGLAKQ